MTDKLIEAVAEAIKDNISVSVSAYGDPLVFDEQEDAARAAIAAIEASGTHRVVPVEVIEALRKATDELKAIRARDGAPQHIDWYGGRPLQTSSCTEEYWDALTEECCAALHAAAPKVAP